MLTELSPGVQQARSDRLCAPAARTVRYGAEIAYLAIGFANTGNASLQRQSIFQIGAYAISYFTY
jgi:hypothetical protein